MIWIVTIVGGMLVALAFVLLRKGSKSGSIKNQDFDSIKRTLWELFNRTLVGSTVLVDYESRQLMIGFIKSDTGTPGRVRLVFPDTDWNAEPLKLLKEKLVDYNPDYEPGDGGEVRRYFTATSRKEYRNVCQLARDALQALGFSDSDRFTTRVSEYELDLNSGFDAAAYARDIQSVEDIRL